MLKHITQFSFIILVFIIPHRAISQSIDNIDQSPLNAIGQDISNSTISISGATIGEMYDIYIDLDDKGIELVNTGSNLVSVTGATLETISGTANDPVVQVTASSTDIEIIIPRQATCQTYDALTNGGSGIFKDEAQIGAGGTPFVSLSNYQVVSSALSITSITNSSNTLTTNGATTRTLSIVQGLPGQLQEFFVELEDINDVLSIDNIQLAGNNTVNIALGQVSSIGNSTYIQITSTDIQAANTGNNNGTFDLNEELELLFDFSIGGSCPSGNNVQINHAAYWGILGETTPTVFCQKNETNQSISFSEEYPDISITFNSSTSDECIIYGVGYMEQIISIENDGDSDLFNLSFTLEGTDEELNAFDAGNLSYSLDGINYTSITPSNTADMGNTYGCASSITGGADIKTSADVSIPASIPVGETIEFRVITYSCCPSDCINAYNAHGLKIRNISFNDLCGNNLNASNEDINISELEWNATLNSPVNFSQNIPVQYAYIDLLSANLEDFILADDAIIELEVGLPDRLDTGTATDITWLNGDNNPGLPSSTNITDDNFSAQWDINSLEYKNGSISFPLIIDCSESGPDFSLDVNLYITPKNSCTPSVCRIPVFCESLAISTDCPSPCSDGMAHRAYDFYRANVDIIDGDNNGCPDTDNDCDGIPAAVDTDEVAAPAVDPSLIRRYRAIEGDTIVSELTSIVNSNTLGGFKRIMIEDHFGSNSNRNKFDTLGAEIRYVDLDGMTHTAFLDATQANSRQTYRITPALFGLNNNTHLFSDGDTIEAIITYVLERYTGSSSINRSVKNRIYGYTTSNFNGTPYSCTDFAGNITHIYADVINVNKQNVTIEGCNPSDIVADVRFNIGKVQNTQVFPYEYRRIGIVDSFAVRIPDSYTFSNAGVTIERFNYYNEDTISIVPTAILPGVGYSDYVFNLNDPLNNQIFSDNDGPIVPGDETYTFRLIVNASPSCDVARNTSENLDPDNEATFARAILEKYVDSDPVQQIDISRSVRSRVANIGITSYSQTEPYYSNSIAWSFEVSNTDRNGEAENLWAFVEAPGDIDISTLQLFQEDGGAYTEVLLNGNGIFELGSLETQSERNFQVEADILFCQRDSLVIYVGHRCTNYPNSPADAKSKCVEQLTVYVEPKVAQVSSVVTPLANTVNPSDGTTLHGSSSIDMCSPFPVEVQIISGQIEPVNQIILSVPSLQNGLEYVAGSGYLWYDRNGDGILDADGDNDIDDGGAVDDERIPFDPTADAAIANNNGTGNSLLFDIQSLASGSGLFDWASGQYLSGVKELPKNIIYVRFEMQSTCDIVIGTPIITQIFANRALCGNPAIGNGQLRSGFNININGAVAPYTTINTDISEHIFDECDDIEYVNFSFIKDGTAPVTANDSIVVFIPNNLSYSSFGGNNGDRNVDNNPSITVTNIGQYIKWPVPLGLADGERVSFFINLRSIATICTEYEVRMEVQSNLSINCGATTCTDTKIAVSSVTKIFTVELPTFEIEIQELNFNGPNQYEGMFELTNTSNIDFNNNLAIEIYKNDVAGNITGSVLSVISAGSIARGESKNVNFSLSTPEDLSHGITALIPNVNDNCYCNLPDASSRDINIMPWSASSSPLPVELLDFSYEKENCKVELKWSTASEVNFSHFEIYKRSPSSPDFELIKRIEGEYPNGGEYSYSNLYEEKEGGNYLYQLKMVDLDGSVKYSDILAVALECYVNHISVRPNPVANYGTLVVEFNSAQEEEKIQIFNSNGMIVYSENVLTDELGRTTELRIKMNEFQNGFYFIRTSSGKSVKFSVYN